MSLWGNCQGICHEENHGLTSWQTVRSTQKILENNLLRSKQHMSCETKAFCMQQHLGRSWRRSPEARSGQEAAEGTRHEFPEGHVPDYSSIPQRQLTALAFVFHRAGHSFHTDDRCRGPASAELVVAPTRSTGTASVISSCCKREGKCDFIQFYGIGENCRLRFNSRTENPQTVEKFGVSLTSGAEL